MCNATFPATVIRAKTDDGGHHRNAASFARNLFRHYLHYNARREPSQSVCPLLAARVIGGDDLAFFFF